jgi:hypothetical protein
MSEGRVTDAGVRRFSVAATVIFFAAVTAIACRCDRAYRRWLNQVVKENRPFAGSRARMQRAWAGSVERRANLSAVAPVIRSAR